MEAHPLVLAEGLGKRFGTVTALDGITLEVPTGAVLGLLGPNGAGKTTTLRILATLLTPDAGRAWVDGLDVVEQAHAVRTRIGLAGQYAAVDAYLSGLENLVMIGCLTGLGRRAAHKRAEELIERFDLVDAASRPARTYSGGMRRRLDLAASLVTAPTVLFLDEPTAGLDPYGRRALWEILEELTAQGMALLLTTQYMDEADRLADTIAIIDGGTVIAEGTPDQLKALVGGDRLELTARPGDDPTQLAAILESLGTAAPAIDIDAGRVVLSVADGPALLPELSARLAASGLRISDLALRRPTLDDVFLSLTHTGKSANGAVSSSQAPEATPARLTAAPNRPMSTLGIPTRVPLATALRNTGTITWRNLRRLVRVPTLITFATAQPILFVLLFTYAFGGAVHPPGVAHYIDYLLPGVIVLAIGFGASQTGVALADDLTTGMIDRFRALPIASSAVLAGRAAADAVRNLFVICLMISVAAAIGFRFHTSAPAALAAIALAVAVGVAFSFLNAVLGLLVRDAESAGLAGLFPIIILVFTSSTLVPVATMPGWLQTFAKANPITVVVDALRALCLGGPTTRPALQAIAWIIGILAVTAPASVIRYRHATSP